MANSQSIVSFSVEDILQAYVHWGHRTNTRNPKMAHNILTAKNKIHIIDPRKTLVSLDKAVVKIYEDTKKEKNILFVGTNPKFQEYIIEAAEKSGQFYVCKWCCGMMTNWRTIVSSIRSLKKYNEVLEKISKNSEEETKMTKKELGSLQKKRDALHKKFGGILKMGGMPDLIIAMSACHDDMAIREAQCVGVPVIAICDTNANTDNIAYPIPGNDDSIKSIKFYLDIFVKTIMAAMKDNITDKNPGNDTKNNPKPLIKDSLNRSNKIKDAEIAKKEDGIEQIIS